jgi:hypothetical protein
VGHERENAVQGGNIYKCNRLERELVWARQGAHEWSLEAAVTIAVEEQGKKM